MMSYGLTEDGVYPRVQNSFCTPYADEKWKEAIEYYERALAMFREAYGERHPYVASTLNNLGSAWSELGDAKKAIEYMERAHGVFREVYGDEHPSTKTVRGNLDIVRREGYIHGMEGRATKYAPAHRWRGQTGGKGALGRRGDGGNKMLVGSSQGGLEWLYFWRPPGCLGGKNGAKRW